MHHLYFHVVVSEVEGQLKVSQEEVSELRVHFQHLQDLLSLDGVQVAVAQRSHVRIGLPRLGVQVDHLSKDVVLPWERRMRCAVGVIWDLLFDVQEILHMIKTF